MFHIPQRFKDVKRFEEILATISKYELQYLLERTGLKETGLDSISAIPSPQRMRNLFEELGGAFIKLGQVLSLRPDLLPEEYCDEFAELQDNVPPFDDAESLVEQRYKEFDSFILQPLASASIGQVHKAVLDGELVAVKVRRPGIVETMKKDIEIMTYLANLIEQHFDTPGVRLTDIVDEFKEYTRDELDYRVEARNMDKARELVDRVHIPRVTWRSKDLLVLEYMEGTECKELERGNEPGVARTLAASFFTQVFEDGFFHADPHPSNILVKHGTVTLLDYGIVGRLSDARRRQLGHLFRALVQGDVDATVAALDALGIAKDTKAFRSDVRETLRPYYDRALDDIDMGEAVRDGMGLARRHDLTLPRDLVLLGKAVITLEGTCHHLDPSFNLVESAQSYVERLAELQFKEEAVATAKDYASLVSDLPGMARGAFNAVEDADEELELIDEHISSLREEVHAATLTVTAAVIVGSLLVSYALMAGSETFLGFQKLPFAAFVTCSVVLAMVVLRWVEKQLGWAA